MGTATRSSQITLFVIFLGNCFAQPVRRLRRGSADSSGTELDASTTRRRHCRWRGRDTAVDAADQPRRVPPPSTVRHRQESLRRLSSPCCVPSTLTFFRQTWARQVFEHYVARGSSSGSDSKTSRHRPTHTRTSKIGLRDAGHDEHLTGSVYISLMSFFIDNENC